MRSLTNTFKAVLSELRDCNKQVLSGGERVKSLLRDDNVLGFLSFLYFDYTTHGLHVYIIFQLCSSFWGSENETRSHSTDSLHFDVTYHILIQDSGGPSMVSRRGIGSGDKVCRPWGRRTIRNDIKLYYSRKCSKETYQLLLLTCKLYFFHAPFMRRLFV